MHSYNVGAERDQGTDRILLLLLFCCCFLMRCKKSSKRRYVIPFSHLSSRLADRLGSCLEAKITSVHPEATRMIAAELRGTGSYLDRTMRNSMSFAKKNQNQKTPANISIKYSWFSFFLTKKKKVLTKSFSFPVLSSSSLCIYLFFFFFICSWKKRTENWKESKREKKTNASKLWSHAKNTQKGIISFMKPSTF